MRLASPSGSTNSTSLTATLNRRRWSRHSSFPVNTATAFHGNELLVRTGSGTPARQPRWVERPGHNWSTTLGSGKLEHTQDKLPGRYAIPRQASLTVRSTTATTYRYRSVY